MWLLNLLHTLINTVLSYIHLAQNGEIGWQTVNRKAGQPLFILYRSFVRLTIRTRPAITCANRNHLKRSSN